MPRFYSQNRWLFRVGNSKKCFLSTEDFRERCDSNLLAKVSHLVHSAIKSCTRPFLRKHTSYAVTKSLHAASNHFTLASDSFFMRCERKSLRCVRSTICALQRTFMRCEWMFLKNCSFSTMVSLIHFAKLETRKKSLLARKKVNVNNSPSA